MVANILPTDTPLTWGQESKGQTIYFSESSHVVYQIKADDAGSNMVTIFCPQTHPLPRGVGSKGQTISFSESSHVAYQIKGNCRVPTRQGKVREICFFFKVREKSGNSVKWSGK